MAQNCPSHKLPAQSYTCYQHTPVSHMGPQAHCHGPFSVTAQPGHYACATYSQGLCSSNSAHPADLHVCSYCLQSVQMLCKHIELSCKCKALAKNRAWLEGLKQLIPPQRGYPHLKCLPDPPAGHAWVGHLRYAATADTQ